MKKILLTLFCLCAYHLHAQDVTFISGAINPCGNDGQNEYILAQSGATGLDINNLVVGTVQDTLDAAGNCLPFIDGAGLYDYNYAWNGTLGGAPINAQDACGGAAMTCNYFLDASDPAGAAIISDVANLLNTAAACPGLFVSVPSTNIVPAGSEFIIMLGAGGAGTAATLDNPNLNLNFASMCGSGPIYVVVGTNLTGDNGFQSNTLSSTSPFPCRGYILADATTGAELAPIVSYHQSVGTQGSAIDALGDITTNPCTVVPPDVCVMSIAATPGLCDFATQQYALTLTVDYSNTTGENFTITVNGVDYGPYNFIDYPSGSDIVITGLSSDGTTGITASVTENQSLNTLYISALLPSQDPAVDGNGDGNFDNCDEYIELNNPTAADIDLSGYQITDNIGVRHTFPAGTIIPAGSTLSVYNSSYVPAPSCTSGIWNNGGDIATLINTTGDTISQLPYSSSTAGVPVYPELCTSATTYDAPAPCTAPCDLTDAGINSIVCDDNGTPTDPSDDIFTYMVNPIGTDLGTSYSVVVGATSYGPFAYGSNSTAIGTFPISGGDVTYTIIDSEDPLCTLAGTATAPSACSSTCDITASGLIVSVCNDNGTPTDPADDTYTVTFNPTGANIGADYFISINMEFPTGPYTYGTTTPAMGPYFIISGVIPYTIQDATDPACTLDGTITPPASCSGTSCTISSSGLVISACDDNGTPSDGSDDTFTFSIDPTASNASTNYIVTIDGVVSPAVAFNTASSFGPYAIGTSDMTVVIADELDATCSLSTTVSSPAPCVSTGTISGIVYVDVDSSGTHEAGENPFTSPVTIYLIDATGDTIATTSTDASGAFSFTGLDLLGTYTVAMGTVAGYTTTTATSVPVDFAAGNTVTLSNVFGLNEVVNAISLLSFDATKDQNQVYLQWISSREIDNDYYIVEKSNDGLNYSELTIVDAKNNLSGAKYNTIDAHPAQGWNYYRLTSVETSGKKQIEGIRALLFESSDFTLDIFPNPASQYVTLQLSTAKDYMISVIDAFGKTVYQNNMHTSSAQINTGTWATGTYFVKVDDGQNATYKKLIKQ